MQQNKLHIVSLDIPYPADYGGAIDVFYKIKSLYEAGCELYLHCYEYGRERAAILGQYCKEVHYYKRPSGLSNLSLSKPYMVYSRRNDDLLQRLRNADVPILFEGIHTTIYLDDPLLKNRFKAIRTHNIEHQYYAQMARSGSVKLLKLFYKREAGLLKKYELSLHGASTLLPLSLSDSDYFRNIYPDIPTVFIAPFHPYDAVESAIGQGNYCLYHGNLSHPENRDAAFFLLNEVIPNTGAQFIIAGKRPGQDLVDACTKANCRLIADPSKETMDDLVRNAQVHVLPTFQRSGVKLKLLSALYGGRHVLVNEQMLFGTGLNSACHIADGAAGFISKTKELMQRPFTQADKQQRTEQLLPYDKASNAQRLLKTMHML